MSREYDALLAALKEPMFPPGDSPEVARDKLNAVHGHPIADDVGVEWTEFGGVRCAWVDTPESRESPEQDRVLVFCHGGGFIAACGDGYLFYAAMLSRPCRARVLLVDYRLAPEHRFPAALDDCVAAIRGLIASGVEPGNVGLIGDSCGGGLVVSSLIRLRELGAPMPAFGVALGGWFDLEASGESAERPVAFDPFAHPDFIRARGRDYVGPDGDVREPLASPLHADLSGLPPLLLQVGQIDITRDDATRLAAVAGAAGVDVTLEIHPNMIHGFQGLANAGIPECAAALDRVANWMSARAST
jgi:monoterpene epsilon-lactone hydrolase